jgi:predicted RNA polymerase sigma factor
MGFRAVTVETVFRREYGRCVATLIRFLGDIDAAEEAVQDASSVAAPARTRSRPPSTLSIPLRPALTAPTGTPS